LIYKKKIFCQTKPEKKLKFFSGKIKKNNKKQQKTKDIPTQHRKHKQKPCRKEKKVDKGKQKKKIIN